MTEQPKGRVPILEKNYETLEKRVGVLEENMTQTFGNNYNLLVQLSNTDSDFQFEVEKARAIVKELNQFKKEVKKKKMENIGNEILNKADKAGNNDEKTTAVELFSYILKNPVFILLAIVIISIMPIKDFILVGMDSGIWDWAALLNTLVGAILALVFYLFSKAGDGEYAKLIENIKTALTSKNVELQTKYDKMSDELQTLKDENTALKAKISLMDYQLKNPSTQ